MTTDSTGVPAPLEPLFRDQRKVDAEHLKYLVIFHYVFASLSLLGLAFLGLHFSVMRLIFTNPAAFGGKGSGPPPPPELFVVLQIFYLFTALMLVAGGLCNCASGYFMARRKHRLFSMVVAGLDCLQMPFGTALGIFTLIVLARESVIELYSRTD